MLDWALSKLIVSVFTVSLVIFSIFVFSAKRPDVQEDRLKSISERISSRVNGVSDTYSNTTFYFTFTENTTAITLPKKADGKKYNLHFSATEVVIESEDRVESSYFSDIIHCWDPSKINYTTNESRLEKLDSRNISLDFPSGNGFRIVRCELIVSGEVQYHTFLFE